MILNIQHEANWEMIKQRKQKIINKNNQLENAKRVPYEYKRGELVLLRRGNENKYESPFKGPFKILKIFNNGTVCLMVNSVEDTYNICRITPYSATESSNYGGEYNMQISQSRLSHGRQSLVSDIKQK